MSSIFNKNMLDKVMNKLLVNLVCLLIPKKKNRRHFRDKVRDRSLFELIFLSRDSINKLGKVGINNERIESIANRFKKDNVASYTDEFHYNGQCEPKVDKVLYQRYFKNHCGIGSCIECGAFDGINMSNCKFFDDVLHWDTYNFEASPQTFELLSKNRQNSNAKNFNLALSNEKSVMEFMVYKDEGLSAVNSPLKEKDNQSAYWNEKLKNEPFDIVKVDTITYKEFIETNKIKSVNLFSLDVEGHEVSVLQGMDGCDVLPDVLVIEGNERRDYMIYKPYLDKLGYVFDLHLYFNYFYVKREKLGEFGLREL